MKDETEWPIQTWRRRKTHFSIEVVRRARPASTEFDPWEGRGQWIWIIYAYIYPSHWHFSAFSGNNHWQPATDEMPLHGGCTFLEYHWRPGETGLVVSAVKVGADYEHYGDEQHTHDAEGFTPFRDAKTLANWLMIREVAQ